MGDHDVIIIGGGPSGLTAAYFLAKQGKKVMLFERLKEHGLLDHPCGGMVNPIKGFISFNKKPNGIYYNEAEFIFENDMILAYPSLMLFITPDKTKFGMELTSENKNLIFQINKSKVLRALADRAEKAGAQLKYGQKVNRLIVENDTIIGVEINNTQFKAKIVIAAEGLSREFSNQAGLFKNDPLSYCYVHFKFIEGLNLQQKELGQISFFGDAYIPIKKSAIMYHSLGYDKAMIILTSLLDEFKWIYDKSPSDLLNEIIPKIPLLQEYIHKGRITDEKACWMILQKPASLVKNGFIAIGDTVGPLGHTSISTGMLMGKDAALLCNKVLAKDEFKINDFEEYNKYLNNKIFKGVEFEAKMILELLNFTDDELNKIGNTFSEINLEPFFTGSSWQMIKASIKLMFKKKIIKNWKLIKRLF